MDRMRSIRLERCLVGELHHAADLISMPAGRDIHSNISFKHIWYSLGQLPDFSNDLLFLWAAYARLQSKCKHVDVQVLSSRYLLKYEV